MVKQKKLTVIRAYDIGDVIVFSKRFEMKVLFTSGQDPQDHEMPHGRITYQVDNQLMLKLFDTACKTIIFNKDKAIAHHVAEECRNIVGDDVDLVIDSLNIFFMNVRHGKKKNQFDIKETRKHLQNGYSLEISGLDFSNLDDSIDTTMTMIIYDNDHKDVFDGKVSKVLGMIH